MYKSIFAYGVSLLFVIACVTQGEMTDKTPEKTKVELYKNPGCMCCDKWADSLEKNGFEVSIIPIDTLVSFKNDKMIPEELKSCHTAIIDGYVVEGHVPVEDVIYLLDERPEAIGISVPGMPLGSPGMEAADGSVEPFEVYLFKADGTSKVIAKHN